MKYSLERLSKRFKQNWVSLEDKLHPPLLHYYPFAYYAALVQTWQEISILPIILSQVHKSSIQNLNVIKVIILFLSQNIGIE